MTTMAGDYLLDTNILIDLIKEDEKIVARIEEADNVYMPVNALGELYYGAYNSTQLTKHLAETIAIEKNIIVLVTTASTAKVYGQIKSKLKKMGNPIPDNDIWIAAIAMEHDLTVLTGDKHFQAIDGLKLELWVKSKLS